MTATENILQELLHSQETDTDTSREKQDYRPETLNKTAMHIKKLFRLGPFLKGSRLTPS